MASTQATIDLVVRGSNAVNALIQNVGQLQSAVDKINSKTLNLAAPGLQKQANRLSATMEGASARANDLGRDRAQILSDQRQAVERLTQAQIRQQQAIEKTASAERELSKLASRDQLFPRQTDKLKGNLRESAAEAERLGDEMNAASAAAGVLESRLSAIRNAGRKSIAAAGGLIDTNTTLAASNAVNALANQYNRYGDSLRRSAGESKLVGTVLPGQINSFNQFRNQIEQAEASLVSLRAELRRLGTVEAAIDIPVRSLSQGELSTPQSSTELGAAQAAQQENKLREQRNARRAQLASEIAAQEAGLATLEKKTETVGRNIARNQETAARLIKNRDPANTTGLQISLNQIQAQAESLALVANNSEIASTSFNRFTVAAEMASIKLARTQQNTFAALAAGFSGGGSANKPGGLRKPEEVAGARSLVGQVVTEMPTFATGASEAALGGYINMLENLKTLVPGLSIEYRALEEAIARANEEMRSVQLGIVGAPSSRLGSLEAVTQRQKFEEKEQRVQEKRQKDTNDVFEKQNDIVDQINSSRLSGDEKSSLRERTERAVNALIEDRLEDSKEMTRLIERQLKASMDLLKAKPSQVFGVTGEQFLPVTGKLEAGGLVPGSPAAKTQIDEQQRRSADRGLKEEADAFKNLTKYTQEAERNAQKLQAGYDRLDLTQALDEYLTDLSNVEQAADKVLKKLASVPETGQSRVKDFDDRLKAAVDSKGAGNQLSSQTLQLEKLQKRLVEVEIDGVDVSKNKAAVEKLIADIKSGQIPASKQSVDLVARELKDARARLGISQSQAKIDGKIADVLKGAVGGPSKKVNDLAAQQKFATAINDTYQETEKILASIGKASIPDAQKLSLSFGIDQARNELYENRLENAQEITREISKQLGLETALQGTATKKKLTGSSWGLAFAKAEDMRQDMGADALQERTRAQTVMQQQLLALEDLQARYTIAEGKGVKFLDEKLVLGRIINQIKNGELALTEANTKAIGENIRQLNALGRYRKNEAIRDGTLTEGKKGSGATTAEQLEDRRSKLLNVAAGGLSRLIDLENKGVAVSDEKLKVEQAIKDIQLLRGKATQKELVALAQEVAAAKELASIKAVNLKAGAIPGAGLQAALQSLQEARNSRQQFLGTMSPAEGIDKIVREFNTGKAGGAASGAAGVADSVTESFTTGLKTGIPQAVAAAIAFSQAVIEAFRNKFKARSPAKAIIDEVIIPIVQAFEKLRDFSGRGVSAGKFFASSVMDSITGEVPGVTDKARYEDIGARNPKTPGLSFGLDPNVALRLGGGRVTGGYPPVSGIFAPGSTPPIGGSGSGYPFFPPYQMTGTKLPTPGMKGAQFPVDPMVDLRQNRSEDTSKVVVDRIKQFRADVANFWEGTDSQFEAVSRVLKSSIQLSAARFARRLQQSKALTPDQEFKQVANEVKSLLPAGGSSELSGVVARAKQGIKRLSEFFKGIGDFDYDDPSTEMSKQIQRGIFSEGGATFGKTFVSGQGRDRYKLGYSEGMLGIPDDLQDIPLEGGNKIRNAVESFYDKIVKSLGGLGGPGGPGGPRPPAGGGAGGGFYSDPGDLARRATEAAQQGPEALLGLKELAAPAKVSTKELEALSAILKEFRSVLDPTVEGFDQLNKRLRNTAGNIDRQLERRAPDADFLTRSVGPRGGAAISEGLIGGAFPLLFGQGVGASVGGGLGGALGGFAGGGLGFGLSLIGTALGTAFDTAVQSATELGAALVDTSKTFDLVKDRSLFSSKETEKLATKLSEMGFAASASILAQQEIINKVGATGYGSLTDLASASDEAARAWSEFNLQLQAALAGPMAGLLEWVTSILALQNQSARSQQFVKDVSGGLGGEVKQGFDREAKIISGREAQGSTMFGTLFGGISKEDATKQRNELAQAYADFAIPVKIEPKLTDKQKIEQELAMLGKGLEVLDAGKPLKDAVRQAAREQQDLDKQRADLVRSYEESIGNIRKQVEGEVSRRRFSILEKENQLLDLQGENRIKQLEAANAQTVALAGRGERSEVAGVAQEVAQIVADFTEQQLSAEEQAAKIKRDAALDARKFDFEAGQFKANIEKEVARLNIETARQVAGINEGVRRRNEETDSRRFSIEKSIAILKMQQLQDELSVASYTNSGLTASDQKMMTDIYYGIGNNIKFLREAKPPAKLQEVAQVGGAGVPTANFDAIVAKEQGAIQALVDEALKGVDLAVKGSRQALAQALLSVTDNIDQSLKDVETREADAEANRLRRIELINAGLTESVAQRVMELEQVKKIALAQYDAAVAEVEGRIVKEAKTAAQLATNAALREEIKLIKERKDALEGKFGTFDATTGTGTGAIGSVTTSQRGNEIQEFITKTTAELNNLEQVAINVSQGIGDAVGNSLANGITGLIEGTTTAKQVFADFLKSIGQMLVQEGTKMIAMYIAIAIAKAFAGMSGGGGDPVKPGGDWMSAVGRMSPNANGNAFGANGIMPFANGGAFTNSIVRSPTLFKFADGGTTRTGLMGEAGPEAIMPLKRGADGSLGVQANGLRSAMGRPPGGATTTPVLNMSFQSTTINGVEYVSRDQLEAAMAETRRQAAKEGASRGMDMTLDKIQNSPSTRSRVGIR